MSKHEANVKQQIETWLNTIPSSSIEEWKTVLDKKADDIEKEQGLEVCMTSLPFRANVALDRFTKGIPLTEQDAIHVAEAIATFHSLTLTFSGSGRSAKD